MYFKFTFQFWCTGVERIGGVGGGKTRSQGSPTYFAAIFEHTFM